jgi:hypothetical protein
MPGTLAGWSGPASVNYAGACMTNGSACEAAAQALSEAERAARIYAEALEEAQRDAEHAIEDPATPNSGSTGRSSGSKPRRRAARTPSCARRPPAPRSR